jgi:hypothetical protein
MKRRSNTTTAILVIALLIGVAFVSAAINPPPPSANAPEKHEEEGKKEQELGGKTPPSEQTKSEKPATNATAPVPEASKQIQAEMTKMMKIRQKMEAAMPKPADDPNAINVSPDVYYRGADGQKGNEEMAARMKVQEQKVKKIRADMAKVPPPSKEVQNMMSEQMKTQSP